MPVASDVSAAHLRTLRDALLTPEPELGQAVGAIGRALGLSRDDARDVVRGVVLNLSASLFPPISHLELLHTEGCNLACTYCFEREMHRPAKMTPEVTRRAVDLLFEYSREERELEITHFGGEPTLHLAGVRLATEYAEQRARSTGKSISFDLTSNGLLLDDAVVGYLADHRIKVLLSIDGLAATHDRFRVDRRGRGTFERVRRGLEALKRRQPWIGAKLTVMPENAGTLYADVLGLYDLGVNHFVIGHATGVDWSADALAAFGHELRRLWRWYRRRDRSDVRIHDFEKPRAARAFGCWAGATSIAVGVRGDIGPCSKVMGSPSARRDGKLGDVWHGVTHLRRRAELVGCAQLRAACAASGIEGEYQGGCFAVNHADTGDLFRPSPREHAITLVRRAARASR